MTLRNLEMSLERGVSSAFKPEANIAIRPIIVRSPVRTTKPRAVPEVLY
jgi:hypothetical protein